MGYVYEDLLQLRLPTVQRMPQLKFCVAVSCCLKSAFFLSLFLVWDLKNSKRGQYMKQSHKDLQMNQRRASTATAKCGIGLLKKKKNLEED